MDDFNPLVLLIPFIAGFIGWFTNWLAVKATLYPIDFVGIPPLGWQGVIPKNTEEMSKSNFSELIHDKLVDMEKIFANIDHDDNEELDKVVEDVSQEIIREFSTNIAPDSWARASEKLREYINDARAIATSAASRWKSSTAWPRRQVTSSTSTKSPTRRWSRIGHCSAAC